MTSDERNDDDEYPVLVLGETVRVHGVYVAHWEVARFELRRRRRYRWLGDARVLCLLEPREGIADGVRDVAGVPQPDNWRLHPGLRFDVVADVTPVEYGRFGHRGMLRWRLRVEEWVSVAQVDRRTGS